jgi:hypothetical protein
MNQELIKRYYDFEKEMFVKYSNENDKNKPRMTGEG